MACSSWYEQDAEELVKSITGLQNGNNFDRCTDYVIYNLRYHTYLDVNSHKVMRSIDGLYDKLLIHSQNLKAEKFRTNCATFLGSPVFKEHSTQDVQFSLLALLFELANNPTKSDYINLALQNSEKGPLESLDGVKNALDVVNFLPTVSYFSDLSDDDSVESLTTDLTTSELPNPQNLTTSSSSCHLSPKELPNIGVNVLSDMKPCGRAWLGQHLQIPYWSNISSNEASQSQSLSLSANLRRQWETYVTSSMPIINFGFAVELSERQLIREILWMLEGRKQTHLFQLKKGGVLCINPEISVCHLTKNTLSNMLKPLAQKGSSLFKLRWFVEATTTSVMAGVEGDQSFGQQDENSYHLHFPRTQTYNAFSVVLSEWLLLFTKHVEQLERIIVMQEGSMTFSTVMVQLDPWFSSLDAILAVYDAGIESVLEDKPPWYRASHLLNILYLAIVQIDGTGAAVRDKASLITAIFLKTVCPYLEIIDSWITVGHLQDPCHEFIIERNKEVTSLDESFWNTSIVMRTHRSKQNEVLFLKPVLNKIILIGKSMELLHCLGKLQGVTQHMVQDSQNSLFKIFIKRFCRILDDCSEHSLGNSNGSSDSVMDEESTSLRSPTTCESNLFLAYLKQHVIKSLEVEDVYDPIMTKLMQEHFEADTTKKTKSHTTDEISLKQLIDIVQSSGSQIITDAINSAITPNIHEKYKFVCKNLIDILKMDYHLEDCLITMRKYSLMERGDVLFHFYSQVFEKMPHANLSLEEEINMNVILDDALLIYCPEDVGKITIHLNESLKSNIFNPIDSYKTINFVYGITWPLDIIMNAACRERYSKIFAFLLQIKHAKYCLDELRFNELSPPQMNAGRYSCSSQLGNGNDKKTTKAIQLFRVKLLYFVNTLHNHLMTRILHSSEPILHKLLNTSSTDLQLLILAHEEYVQNLFEQSLLHSNMAVFKKNIVKILNLAVVFSNCWKGGINNISWKMLREMDEDIKSCQKFLQGFIWHLAPKGNLNYLESMVEDLAHSEQKAI